MKKFFLALLLLAGCASEQTGTTPDTPITETPVVVEAPKLQVLDAFVQPEFSTEENWKTKVNRTVFSNQATGYIVRGDLCLLVGKAFQMPFVEITKPSATNYKPGKYVDPITEMLTADNCKQTKYAWLELSDSFNEQGLSITLTKVGESGEMALQVSIALSPYTFTFWLHGSKYVENTESLGLQPQKLLRDHGFILHKAWVTDYDVSASYPFSKYVTEKKFINVPINAKESNTTKADTAFKSLQAWFYVVDEPSDADLAKYKTQLARLKVIAPNTQRMVTTTYKESYKDLIDMFCPVMEHLDNVPSSVYKNRCAYTSCMANGCDENRAWPKSGDVNNYSRRDYPATGSPDLAIDGPRNGAFGFLMVGVKYDLDFLLYYNAIENWSLIGKGVNILTDTDNFSSHGDGTLVYPNFVNKTAYPSLRLKDIREATFMVTAAKKNGKLQLLKDRVQNALNWSFTDSLRDEVYKQ